MRKSTISTNEGRDELHLSGPVSEWLFSSASRYFWSSFNKKHGTMFDQYEEDDADSLVVKEVAAALGEKIRILQHQDEDTIVFSSRWAVKNDGSIKPIMTDISRDLLLSELITFRGFLVDAAVKGCSVTFSL